MSPQDWPSRLRQIFSQACWPSVQPRLPIRPVLSQEHAKALLLVGLFWRGHTTRERVPNWIKDLAAPSLRDQGLEILADHVRNHLGREISVRKERSRQCGSGPV
ncbi:hypothetical protein [Ferrimicrobium sp.]|uniref:hypothetical protein n=1 Tax=Ferrimicrobium sp. TaxID=2926050 RepID=UPI0026091888|nr:hypothetical protein [Ferrimicrobium sp.]